MRLGITDWPGYEYIYLAQEWGLVEAQGLRLQVNQHSSLKDQRFSYEQGDVDALATTVSEALVICQENPQRHPQQVAALVNTWWMARREARRRPAEAQALLARREGIPLEDFCRSEAMLRDVDGSQQRVWLMPGGWMETTVRRMAQRLQAAGRLPRAMPLPAITSQWAGGDGGP